MIHINNTVSTFRRRVTLLCALAFALSATVALSACGNEDTDEPQPPVQQGYLTPQTYAGTTTVTCTDAPETVPTVVNNNITYTLTFDLAKRTLSMVIKNFKVADRMPEIDVDLSDITLVVNGDNFTFEAANIIPSSGGRPFPQVPFSNLIGSGSVGAGAKMQIKFDTDVAFTGHQYTVVANDLKIK